MYRFFFIVLLPLCAIAGVYCGGDGGVIEPFRYKGVTYICTESDNGIRYVGAVGNVPKPVSFAASLSRRVIEKYENDLKDLRAISPEIQQAMPLMRWLVKCGGDDSGKYKFGT